MEWEDDEKEDWEGEGGFWCVFALKGLWLGAQSVYEGQNSTPRRKCG